MNTEQVVEMIDAITEGEEFHHVFDTHVGSLELFMTEYGFSIRPEGDGTVCIDPRTAREIAGALIAWANHKESAANGANKAIAAMGYDYVATRQVAAFDANNREDN